MKISFLSVFPALAGLALFGQSSTAKALMTHQAEVLKDAKSLSVTFTARQATSPAVEYKLTYSKPNLLRIESPTGFTTTDGTTVWVYTKADNSYTEAPGGADALLSRAQQDDVYAWSAFFLTEPLKNVRNLQPGTKRIIKDNPVTEVSFAIGDTGKKTATLYIDQKLGIARGGSIKNEGDAATSDLLVVASDIKIGSEVLPASQFAFTAPAGAKKLEKPAEAPATYASVAEIFTRNCNGCHGGGAPKGGLTTGSYQGLMAGSKSGAVITPGDPDNSLILQYIKGVRQPRMPKNMAPLTDAEVQTISKWIAAGAKEN